MKREYYDRDLGIFLFGLIAGMVMLCIFLALRRYGYETLSWVLMGGSAGMVCAAWGMSKVLNETHTIDELEIASRTGSVETAAAPVAETTPALLFDPSVQNVASLTFPYTTKALEAAQQATIKFWTDYDPERPPLQKSVQSYITERGIPVRQAAELASAIKPDNVSDRSDMATGA